MKREPLTTGQVAEYCHVTYRAVLKWIEEGKLKAYRTPGKHSRVDVKDFLIFLKKFNMPIPVELSSEKRKILIVDDDDRIVKLIRRTLEADGEYEFREANDGFKAGQKFCEFHPDLVILDIKMPGIDGYEVCAHIRSNPVNKRVKILAVSGVIGTEEGGKILKLGANDALTKPFEPSHLKKKVEKLLGTKHVEVSDVSGG